jgi:NadR type nicotinamide-nucleotide adenylyltransferase
VFASEDYGWRLAQELGATFVPVDQARAMVPISGTAVRMNPYQHWQYLSPVVRVNYAKRVVILGAESVGKSTLTQRLAAHYDTVGVEEYARPYFDALVTAGKRAPGEFRYEDLTLIARAQPALIGSLVQRANRLLVADTDSLTTLTWSDHLYGRHEAWHAELVQEESYDLTLVLSPDGTRYVADGQRVMAEQAERVAFTKRLTANLERFGRPYHVLTGTYDERFTHATRLIDQLFD